jgi:D-inositol-3-phosphate glycosyltransferase
MPDATTIAPLPSPVALIEPVGQHGGMHYYDFGLARGLRSAGVEAVLYTCDETDTHDAPVSVQPLFRGIFGKAPRPVRALRFFSGLMRSLADARRRGARIAHLHLFHGNAREWCAVEMARLVGMRIVVTAHDVESFAGDTVPRMAAHIYAAADRIITHNRASLAELERAFAINDERATVIPHGNYCDAAASAPDRAEARRRLGLPPDAPIVLFFGQIKRVKGLDVLLDAMPAVIAAIPRALLVIAGKVWQDDFERYRERLAQAELRGHVVTDLRYVPDDVAAEYLRAADIVVLPYRRIYQSGVLLMAMSFGRAVLVSDLPAMVEVVSDDRTGFVFKDGDASDLARQLCRLLRDLPTVERVAAAGNELAQSEFDWTRIGAMTRAVYEAVSA